MWHRLSRRWVIFFVSSALFVLSQFYRAAIAVITPQLISDLSLNTQEVSLMSAAFFYAFAIMQVPIAVYLDQIGAKKTMIVLNLIAVAGALIFGTASSSHLLSIGRALLGVGMACNLMGTLKLTAAWFSPRQFATLAAVVFSMGTAGNIIATTPLVFLVESIGWRFSFLSVALINLLLIILFSQTVRDAAEVPSTNQAASRRLKETLSGIWELFTIRDYWIISLSTFCRYGIYAAIQGLYAGPYLLFAMGLPPLAVGNIILGMNLGFVCGGPLFGWISDRKLRSRKRVIIPGLLGFGAVLAVLAVLPQGVGILPLAALFFILGVFNSSAGIMYPHIKESMPPEKSGMAMAGINFFTMIGPAVFLQGLGMFMQAAYPDNAWSPMAFQHVFWICSFCLASVSALYLLTRDRRTASRAA
jgi:MFS family permease